MTQDRWTEVTRYLSNVLELDDEALAAALAASEAAGLPAISVAPNEGRLLALLARAVGARRILEIGTLGGYSAIWLARALAHGGKLVTLEVDPKHADVARANLMHAGLIEAVEIRVGAALETLPKLAAERGAPFDFVFIDADKPNIPEYFAWAVKLARRGSLIVVDNVVRDGAVADSASTDPAVHGVRRLNKAMAEQPLVSATVIQTVGAKGYDGFALALVVGEPGN